MFFVCCRGGASLRPLLWPLSPPVLVPGLDLGVAELQRGRQLHAVLDTQVLLAPEASLQPGQLLVAERRPSFAALLQTGRRWSRSPVGRGERGRVICDTTHRSA